MSKYQADPSDPYIDTSHQVLRNRLGILDRVELERTEAALSAVRLYELAHNPVRGRFDLNHLKQIHKRLFSDIYSWADELRTVDISKGNTRFAHHAHIDSYAPIITNALDREGQLKGLPPDKFSNHAGHYLGELNVLHPFREGNGRTLRAFFRQLAHEAGYEILWHRIDREANIQASVAAYQGDSSRLAKLIEDNLLDFDREAAIELAKEVVGDQVHIELPIAGRQYHGLVVGETDRYIVQQQADATNHVIVHQRQTVVTSGWPQPGQIVTIDYSSGRFGIVREAESSYKQTFQKDRGL